MFVSIVISEGLPLVIRFIHVFATYSAIAFIFLILIQLEDIISRFDVTVISDFFV